MSKHRHGGRQKSYGGSAGGGRGGGGRGGGGGGNKQGKLSYDAGDEPAFIRQFKERTGYKAPSTTDDKRRIMINDNEDRPSDGDYRKDDEKPQIVQLNANDLSKEEVDVEIAKVKEVEEEKKCIDSTGRLLFRKPKEKSDESDAATTTTKSDIVEVASNKTIKRKNPPASTTPKETDSGNSNEKKKTKTQLLSFMDESGFDGDD